MSSIMVDMDAVTQSLWTKNNEVQLVKTLVQQVGMMTSALEHRIPELLFTNEENPGEAISAVKALALASAQGQRIYQITSENVSVVLPQLTISSEVKDEIQASVAVGKVATVSQNNITVGGWTGVGYIIADPETGAGAYRISGGANGGKAFIAGLLAGISFVCMISLLALLPILTAPLIVGGLKLNFVFKTVVTMIVAAAIYVKLIEGIEHAQQYYPEDTDCILSGFFAAIALGGVLLLFVALSTAVPFWIGAALVFPALFDALFWSPRSAAQCFGWIP